MEGGNKKRPKIRNINPEIPKLKKKKGFPKIQNKRLSERCQLVPSNCCSFNLDVVGSHKSKYLVILKIR